MKFRFILDVILLHFYISGCHSIAFNESITVSSDCLLSRNKRQIYQPNKNYQECKTPIGTAGHCKSIQHCPLPELQENILRSLNYLCVIEQTSIGVCCPEEVSRNRAASALNIYPQQADDAERALLELGQGRDASGRSIINRGEERGCGLPTKEFAKIVGGRPSDPAEWPWMAALMRDDVPNAYCGGVLITDRHVMTAAHCTYQYNKNQITVRLGEYNFLEKNETRARDFKIVELRQHLEFDEITYDNDIAILKLNKVVVLDGYVWPICMPPPMETFEGYTAIVIGWGTKFFGGPASDILMQVPLPIWKREDCQKRFIERIDENRNLCAGAPEGGRDSCQGDSGGPLLVQLPNKRWVAVGIVSWGIRCGEKNRPGVYTRVNSFSPWIVENSIF